MGFLAALAEHAFLQYALLGCLLAAVGCGVIGPFVVVQRMSYLAGGIAHSVLGGMGIAYFLGGDPLAGALAAAVIAALVIGGARRLVRHDADTLISAVWAVGMAVGVLFMARAPGYGTDLLGYLFGDILLIDPRKLVFLAVLDAVAVLVLLAGYRAFLAVAFDEEFARVRGLRTGRVQQVFLVLVALLVVVLVQVVGLILLIALLTLPAAMAGQHVRTVGAMIPVAMGLGAVLSTAGLATAYAFDLPAGATIILWVAMAYLSSSAWRRLRD
jgi:zinc transport system permease protein